jgi:hypothetical protein
MSLANKNHATVYQEAGFLAMEISWIHTLVEHGYNLWWIGVILVAGIAYARFGTIWAVDLHNKRIISQANEFVRWVMIMGLVIVVLLIPYAVLKFGLFLL